MCLLPQEELERLSGVSAFATVRSDALRTSIRSLALSRPAWNVGSSPGCRTCVKDGMLLIAGNASTCMFLGLVAALSREALMCCFTSVVEPCHTASKAPDAARNDCERAQVPPTPPCLVGHLYSSAVVFPSSFGLLQYIINHKLMRQRPTKEAATAMRTSNEMV